MFREMRRKKQLLTPEERAAVLHRGTSGVLALAGDDGYPYAVPMSYVYDGAKLYFHCAKSGHKLDAIRRNCKASFCVIDQDQIVPEEYTSHFRSVIVFGTMRILEDDGEKRAAIEALKGTLYNNTCKGTPQIFYVGNSISPAYLQSVLDACEGKDISVNVISKSGTTTEPALAFRIFKALLEKKYGKDGAKGRIYATTDKARGTLKELSADEGYETFVVPDDVGGRYSVLTAVGLLPIAAAGCDIDALMAGAAKAREELAVCSTQNECYRYAAARNILYRKGKSVELMACYEPNFTMMNEWYKQLFGESEGKDQKGLFPASVIFSTDLHSMGQFVQDGARIMFETVVDIKQPQRDLYIEKSADNFDGLDFLAGQDMSVVNRKAMEGTILAHTDGGVPNIILEVDSLTGRPWLSDLFL